MCCPPVQTICNDLMTRELVTAEQLQRETDYYRANDLHSLAMSVAGHSPRGHVLQVCPPSFLLLMPRGVGWGGGGQGGVACSTPEQHGRLTHSSGVAAGEEQGAAS